MKTKLIIKIVNIAQIVLAVIATIMFIKAFKLLYTFLLMEGKGF
ncbi:MAG: hypothetical protein N2053_11185 [Chitinispirillaceae bacterium]|nr:hypothetical protein [Chitinispirillaceae bacterium]